MQEMVLIIRVFIMKCCTKMTKTYNQFKSIIYFRQYIWIGNIYWYERNTYQSRSNKKSYLKILNHLNNISRFDAWLGRVNIAFTF